MLDAVPFDATIVLVHGEMRCNIYLIDISPFFFCFSLDIREIYFDNLFYFLFILFYFYIFSHHVAFFSSFLACTFNNKQIFRFN